MSRLRQASIAAIGGVVTLAQVIAQAQVMRLDDSASPRARVPAIVSVDEQGRPIETSPFATRAIMRFGRVDYVLTTAPFLGRRARIYLVLPTPPRLLSSAGLRLEWRGLGRFESGNLQAGNRQLLWSGTIDQHMFRESVDLSGFVEFSAWRLDATGSVNFETHFEIELLP